MDTLYSWRAVRSGATITLHHSCGKIAGIKGLAPNENGQIVACKGEQSFLLATPPHLHADHVNIGVSDIFFNFEDAVAAYRLEDEEEQKTAMLAAAESLRTMLRGAQIAPPTAEALVADFLDRV